jgi:hypothetical protein
MNVAEFHPDDLIDKANEGTLTAAEATLLHLHLERCATCRMECQLRNDFAAEHQSFSAANEALAPAAAKLAPAATEEDGDRALEQLRADFESELARGPAEQRQLETAIERALRELPKVVPIRRVRKGAVPMLVRLSAAACIFFVAGFAFAKPQILASALRRVADLIAEEPKPVEKPSVHGSLAGQPSASEPASRLTAQASAAQADPAAPLVVASRDTVPEPAAQDKPQGQGIPNRPVFADTFLPKKQAAAAVLNPEASEPAVAAPIVASAVVASAEPAVAPVERRTAATLLADARASAQRGDQDGAAKLLSILQDTHPHSQEAHVAWTMLAKGHLSSGNAALARKAYAAYLATGDRALRAEAHRGVALACKAMGDSDGERAAFRALEEEFPDSSYVRHAP